VKSRRKPSHSLVKLALVAIEVAYYADIPAAEWGTCYAAVDFEVGEAVGVATNGPAGVD